LKKPALCIEEKSKYSIGNKLCVGGGVIGNRWIRSLIRVVKEWDVMGDG